MKLSFKCFIYTVVCCCVSLSAYSGEWGAAAIDKYDGQLIVEAVWNIETKEEAKRLAKKACFDSGGNGCGKVKFAHNNCLSVYVTEDVRWNSSRRDTKHAAITAARERCEERGDDCERAIAFCAGN